MVQRLTGPVREYSWGSREVIAGLQGRPVPSPGPEAELWLGAHPAAPAVVAGGIPLDDMIAADPVRALSRQVRDRFGARLPYLLKLLAAASPLSLQAHPDADQAAAGYAEEEAAGIARDDPDRRYPDPYHKPELLVAVSEFRALCGFRPPDATARLLAGLGVPALDPVVAALRAGDLATAVRLVLTVRRPAGLVEQVAAAAGVSGPALAAELAAAHPADPGVVLALLLNEVTIAPTEAIFMPAGAPHTYLAGTGVELMAASDNVLRGGLTTKHVDVPELLRVLRYEPLADPVLRPVAVAPGVSTWPVPVAEFALYRVALRDGLDRVEWSLPGPRTLLCLAGEVTVGGAGSEVTLGPGQAGFVVAADGPMLRFQGAGEVYVGAVAGN